MINIWRCFDVTNTWFSFSVSIRLMTLSYIFAIILCGICSTLLSRIRNIWTFLKDYPTTVIIYDQLKNLINGISNLYQWIILYLNHSIPFYCCLRNIWLFKISFFSFKNNIFFQLIFNNHKFISKPIQTLW